MCDRFVAVDYACRRQGSGFVVSTAGIQLQTVGDHPLTACRVSNQLLAVEAHLSVIDRGVRISFIRHGIDCTVCCLTADLFDCIGDFTLTDILTIYFLDLLNDIQAAEHQFPTVFISNYSIVRVKDDDVFVELADIRDLVCRDTVVFFVV